MINKLARVQEVITDKILQEREYNLYGKEDSIGGILFTFIDEPTPYNFDSTQNRFAKPLYYNIAHYPVPGELVHITKAPRQDYNVTGKHMYYYLPSISIYGSPTNDAYPDYVNENDEFYTGKYFPNPDNINPLLPYEGDITIEGRFGQSIRFGSTIDNEKVATPNRWSNEGEIGDPITIIRNGQEFNPQIENGVHTIEDIDNDNSSIYLCSNQQLTDFKPASLYDESYGQDIFTEPPKSEPNISNTRMNNNVEEDIVLTPPNNFPAEELQVVEETIPIKETEYSTNDIAEKEDQTISTTDEVQLTATYEVPDTISDADLNKKYE